MTIKEYINKVDTLYKTGNAREHSYRGDLQNLLMAMLPEVLVTNEPARVACGAPDYVLTKKNIPVGYVEAKDIGVDLAHKSLKEQFDRYKSGLSNLIITDYLQFHFFKDGELREQIEIAKVDSGGVAPIPENFVRFTLLIKDFAETVTQSIKSPSKLAEMMAGKARLMADVIEKSLNKDDELEQTSNLKSQMLSFKSMLIHDIDNKAFSDIYAQTIAYGMFAARYHDPSLADFSRTEAAQLIPKSNPFLRKLFQDIAGFDLDNRLVWIVDELVNIFLASDVAKIMSNFGKSTKQEDPVVHFYETFLGEYNPALKKARGVWYTPEPVVNFIVRAVDDILKTEFGLSQGLADNRKTNIKVDTQMVDKRSTTGYRQETKEVHKVQILDPATGTGTFLAEIVRHIYQRFKGQQGIWSQYVTKDLIPRLNGFEILMASYAMAHLKMDMLLTETGYNSDTDQRFRIFLTNSLEEAHPDTGTLFSSWLSDEANQANTLKRDTPVMCILGNPPYSGISSNTGKWISKLIEDYKYVDGVHFRERKHWLGDDYVKFIRFGQYFIDKNGTGVLAFINPHGFIDNPTFKGMRWNLLNSFDKIFTIDLHGNSLKKETTPTGEPDINVFDIQQGVSINIFVKTGAKKPDSLGKVYHSDVYGGRSHKYDFLLGNDLSSVEFTEVEYSNPFYFFTPKDEDGREHYDSGISVNDLFPLNTVGFVSAMDSLNISYTKEEQQVKIKDILNMDESEWRKIYDRPKDAQSWKYRWAKEDAKQNQDKELTRVSFRPFDVRWSLYTGNSGGLYARPSFKSQSHLLKQDNIAMVVARQCVGDWRYVFVTKYVNDFNLTSTAGRFGSGNTFPLYLFHGDSIKGIGSEKGEWIPNIDKDFVTKIEKSLDIEFSSSETIDSDQFSPRDLFDYVYAVLYSPSYRKKYGEFLKSEFPKIPVPKSVSTFRRLIILGNELVSIHLLESDNLNSLITEYPAGGNNVVTRKMTKSSIGYEEKTSTHGKVWINDSQYFDNVPLLAWEFYIGGYQPAQKWLKDRYGRELSFEDILHYQKIILALVETDRVMKDIDQVGFE